MGDRLERGGDDAAMTSEYVVFCRLDVGKQAPHACALDPAGRRLFDAACPGTRPGCGSCSPGWPGTDGCW
jgi:hypothetical protein